MKNWTILSVFWLGLLGIALFPFLFLGRMFLDSDSTLQFYPFFVVYQQAVQHGWSFLLNPTILLGFPTYLSQSGGYLDPLNWLLYHLPFPAVDVYNLRLVIDFFLAFALSYAVARELKRSQIASLLIGLGYLIAFNWRYLSNALIVNGLFLLPLLVYATLRLFRAKREGERLFWAVISGLGIGWSFLAGNAQFTVEASFLFALFYLSYLYFVADLTFDLRTCARYLGYGLLSFVVALIIAAPQIIPTLQFKSLTVRADGVAYSQAVAKVTEPGDLILFGFPDYLYFPYVSGGRKPLYIGALFFLLALVAIREACKKRSTEGKREHNLVRIFLGLFLFTLAASFKWSPVFYLMLKLPVFDLFRFPYRWMYLGIWFLCVLGAYGFDWFYERAGELKRSWLTRIMAAIYGLVIVLIVALNVFGMRVWGFMIGFAEKIFMYMLYGHGPFTKDPAHYVETFERGIVAWRGFVSFADPSFAIPFGVLLVSCALIYLVYSGRLSRERFGQASFVIGVFTFLSVFVVQWPSSLPRSIADAHTNLLTQAGAQNNLEVYRTFPFMISHVLTIPPTYSLADDQVVAIEEGQFLGGAPNTQVYDPAVRSVDGYDVFAPVDFAKGLSLIGSTQTGADYAGGLSDAQRTEQLISNLDILGMLSGKYIISGVPLSSKKLTLRTTQTATHLGGQIWVYQNALALPEWYFAVHVVFKPLHTLSDLVNDTSARNFADRAYLDCTDCLSGGVASPSDTIAVRAQTFATYEFTTHTTAARWFIFGYAYLPGWELQIDDKIAPIVRANGTLMAAYIPAGYHVVRFSYRGMAGESRIYEALGIFHEPR